jgi:hypothetical protein
MKPGARTRFVEGLKERRARHKERHHLIASQPRSAAS